MVFEHAQRHARACTNTHRSEGAPSNSNTKEKGGNPLSEREPGKVKHKDIHKHKMMHFISYSLEHISYVLRTIRPLVNVVQLGMGLLWVFVAYFKVPVRLYPPQAYSKRFYQCQSSNHCQPTAFRH